MLLDECEVLFFLFDVILPAQVYLVFPLLLPFAQLSFRFLFSVPLGNFFRLLLGIKISPPLLIRLLHLCHTIALLLSKIIFHLGNELALC